MSKLTVLPLVVLALLVSACDYSGKMGLSPAMVSYPPPPDQRHYVYNGYYQGQYYPGYRYYNPAYPDAPHYYNPSVQTVPYPTHGSGQLRDTPQ